MEFHPEWLLAIPPLGVIAGVLVVSTKHVIKWSVDSSRSEFIKDMGLWMWFFAFMMPTVIGWGFSIISIIFLLGHPMSEVF